VKKSSDPELDNKIIVYGHQNNNLGYWYNCGSKDKLHFDFKDVINWNLKQNKNY
jgi:hypothetical protein